MNIIMIHLDQLLIAAAIGQILIAIINLRLDRLLNWQKELHQISSLLREVFYVHKWFITITLLIFGIITIRFAGDIAHPSYEMPRWFAAGVGIFWAIRTLFQWTYYSKDHWIGNCGRTAIHWILTICYGGCAATYLIAAFQ
jgi:hypothetical protein